MFHTAKILVLASSLVLMLPHGWCCFLPGLLFSPGERDAVPSICCCECEPRPQAPAEEPVPFPTERCHCCDRQVVLSKAGEEFQPDVGPVEFHLDWTETPAILAFSNDPFTTLHGPAHRLHVIQCEWRC